MVEDTLADLRYKTIHIYKQHWSRFLDVDCGNAGPIAHGKVTLATNATYYGAAVLYECDKNYQLDGVSRRLCQDNGTWSSEEPACVGKYLIHYQKLLNDLMNIIPDIDSYA